VGPGAYGQYTACSYYHPLSEYEQFVNSYNYYYNNYNIIWMPASFCIYILASVLHPELASKNYSDIRILYKKVEIPLLT
jgi:hypothetical protein